MVNKVATAQIVQMTTEQNPDGVPIGGFRMTLFRAPFEQEAVYVDAKDFNPQEQQEVTFAVTQPGGYFVECTRLTQSGLAIGPTATSGTVYVGDGTDTFQAPLVLALGMSAPPQS